MIPRYLHAYCPAMVDGIVLENIKYKVETLTANGICGGYKKVYPLLEHSKVFLECHSEEFEILSGREFYFNQ